MDNFCDGDTVKSVFQRFQLLSKEDILESFRLSMDYIESDESLTEASRQLKLRLCNKFLKAVEKSKLPDLNYFWCYEYEFTYYSIDLHLFETTLTGITLSEDGKEISSIETISDSVLISIEYDYVSIEQFANIQEVTPATVQNWIHRGKLRGVKYINGVWLIPSFEDRPSRKYDSVDYTITEPLRINEFPLIAAAERVAIYQNEEDKKTYKCYFANHETHFQQEMSLSRQEVEALEYALISSGKAKAGAKLQFLPYLVRSKSE